jgi:hypothetical protein
MPYLGNVPSSFNVGTNNIDNDAITTEKIAAGAVVNADVNAAAAIAGTKISPDFGSQNILTTGTSTAASFSPSSSTVPTNGFYLPSANNLAISTNGTGRLFVDANGKLGVGTASPADILHLSNAGDLYLRVANTSTGINAYLGQDSNGTYIGNTGASVVRFIQGASERMRLDTSGRLGLGTSSPQYNLHVSSATDTAIQIEATSTSNAELRLKTTTRDWLTYTDSSGAYILRDRTVGREVLRADTSGRVGIGTTSPNRTLTLYDSSTPIIQLINSSSGTTSGSGSQIYRSSTGFVIEEQGALPIQFLVNGGSERARIDSSGRLFVGTSSGRTVGSVTGNIQIEGVTDTGMTITDNSNGSAGDSTWLVLARTRGTAVGGTTAVSNGDWLGNLDFGQVDGAVSGGGVGDMPGRLVFSTTADGASSPTERMRIASGGQLYLNRTSIVSANVISSFQFAGGGAQYGLNLHNASLTSSDQWLEFTSGTSTVRGSVDWSGSAVRYNTSSDYRLKENVEPIANAISRLNQLNPSRFNFIEYPEQTVDGFIAHEVYDVVPEAVSGEKDAVDADGNPKYQGIDQSKLVPLLTAALQEAIAKIETLEARLTAAGI